MNHKKQSFLYEKNGLNSQQIVEEDQTNHNQKKSHQQSSAKKVIQPKFYVNDYMKTIIKEKGTSGEFYCSLCPGKLKIKKKSVYRHLIESLAHANVVPTSQKEAHEEMIKLIKEKIENNKIKKNKSSEEKNSGKKTYLEFLAFCQALNLTFNQISDLGKFFKDLAEEDKLLFFKDFTFEREEISMLAKCFGKCLIDELKKDLEESPFSLSIDNSTIARINICALKVRYLKEIPDVNGLKNTKIMNKVVGIKYLSDSSSSQTLFDLTQEKLLSLSPKVEANFVGLAHDHAASLSGPKKGLGELLKQKLDKPFMDLKDPCHSLNLVLTKSFSKLPSSFLEFIDDIHHHFSSPQRIAFLHKIQKENILRVLGLKHYVKTRWLSLGLSLERLILIWDPLILYMKQEPNFTELKKTQFEKFLLQLKDNEFKMKILVFSCLVAKMNAVNVIFQNQSLEIQHLKNQIQHCIREIGSLFIHPDHTVTNCLDLEENDWSIADQAKPKFLSPKDFISTLSAELDPRISEIDSWSEGSQNEFTETFQCYLCETLRLLLKYLPYKSSLINVLDFVTMSAPSKELKQKIITFNNFFEIIGSDQMVYLTNEIGRIITEDDFVWMKKSSKNSSLQLWDFIQDNCNENHKDLLSKIFKTAHALPTTSAGIEQSFSWLKLIRNVLRSNLQEETTQALLLIAQAFHSKDFIISDEMLNSYEEIKANLMERKVQSGITISLPKREEQNNENLQILEQEIVLSKEGNKRGPSQSLQPLKNSLKFLKANNQNQNEEIDSVWNNIEEALQEEELEEEDQNEAEGKEEFEFHVTE